MGGGTEAGSLLLRAEGHLYHSKTKEGYSHWCVNIIAKSKKNIQFVVIDNAPKQKSCLVKGGCAKSDEFLEKFQTAFAPPLIFGNFYCIFFYNRLDMVAYMQGGMRAR